MEQETLFMLRRFNDIVPRAVQ